MHTTLDLPPPSRPRRALRAAGALLVLASAALLVLASAALRAQPSQDETVTMSEFDVSASSQEGYAASESMTGSRIPTQIKDLPYNVDVITSQFLQDFDIVDPSQIFLGGVVTQDQDAGNTYTVRGISPTGELVNGFWMPAGIPIPTALDDRIEVIKGPSAGAYGQTAPGGLINLVFKQPTWKFDDEARFTYGNYGWHQATLNSDGLIGSKTAYRVILDYNERSFNQPWHEDRNRTAAVEVTHQFDDSSRLTVDLIADGQRNHSPVNRVPYLFNSKTGQYYGVAYNLGNISETGPNSYTNVDDYSSFVVYEKRLSDIFSVRLGNDFYADNNRSFNTTPDTSYDPNPADAESNLYSSEFYGINRDRSATSSYSAPAYKVDNKDGGGAQADLLAHYPLFHGAADNRTLLTFDFQSMYEYVIKLQSPQTPKTQSNGSPSLNSNGTVATSNAVDPAVEPTYPQYAGDTNYWLPVINPLGPPVVDGPNGLPESIYNVPGPGSGNYILSSWEKARTDDFGTMLRQQTTLWEKVLLYASVRFDNVMYNNFTLQHPTWSLAAHPTWASNWNYDNIEKNPNPIAHYHSDAFTPSFGVSYRVTPDLSAYANESQSFMASTQEVTGATTGSYFLPNQRGVGYDYGLKGSWFQNRVTANVGGFYILQKNMAVTAENALGQTIEEAAGTVTSKGVEVETNYYVTNQLAFNAGWYHTNARWGSTGVDLDESGRSKAGVPPDIVTAAANYGFAGALTGLHLMALYQYTGKTRAEDGGGQTVNGIVPVGSNNGLRNIDLVGEYTLNVGAAYDLPELTIGDHKLAQRVQVNVGNLFNHTYVTYSRSFGDSRSYRISYDIAY